MNREILFKAKHILLDKWYEGYYVKIGILHYIAVTDEGFENGYRLVEINPDTICQYTGLTDKNGNKIWENDICHYHGPSDDVCVIRYGEYHDNSRECHIGFFTDWQEFGYMFRQDLGFWVAEREIEVIGNTFDNPELLEGGATNE